MFNKSNKAWLIFGSLMTINGFTTAVHTNDQVLSHREVTLAGFGSYFPSVFFSKNEEPRTTKEEANSEVIEMVTQAESKVAVTPETHKKASSSFAGIKNSFKKAKEAMAQKIDALKMSLEEETRRADVLQQQLNSISHSSQVDRDEIQQLTNLLKERQAHSETLITKHEQELESALSNYQHSLAEKTHTVEELTESIQRMQQTMLAQSKEIRKKEQDLNSLRTFCADKDDQWSALCEREREYCQNFENLTKKQQLLSSDYTNLKTAYQSKEEDYTRLKKEYQQCKREMLSDIDEVSLSLKEQKNTTDVLKKQLDHTLAELQEKTQERDALAVEVKEKDQLKTQVLQYEQALAKAETHSSEKNHTIDELKLEVEKTKNSALTQAEKLTTTETELASLRDLYNEQKEKYFSSCEKEKDYSQQIDELTAKFSVLNTTNMDLQNALIASQKVAQELNDDYNNYQKMMIGRVNEVAVELSEQQRHCTDLKDVLEQTLATLSEKEAEYYELFAEFTQMNQLVDDTQSQLFAREDALKELILVKDVAVYDLERIGTELSKEQEKNKDTSDLLVTKQRELDEVEYKYADLSRDYGDKSSQCRTLLAKSEQLQKDLAAKIQEHEKLDVQHSALRISLAEYEKDLQELQVIFSQEKELTAQLEGKLQTAFSSLEQHNEIIQDLEHQLADEKDKIEVKNEELARVLESNDSLTTLLDEETKGKEHLQQRLTTAFEALSQKSSQTKELEIQLTDAHLQAKTLREELVAASDENLCLEDQHMTLKAVVAVLEQSKNGLSEELAVKQGEATDLLEKYAALEVHMEEKLEQFGSKLKQENFRAAELETSLQQTIADLKQEEKLNQQYVSELKQTVQKYDLNKEALSQLETELATERERTVEFQREAEGLHKLMVDQQYQEGCLREELNASLASLDERSQYVDSLECKLEASGRSLSETISLLTKKDCELSDLKEVCETTVEREESRIASLSEELIEKKQSFSELNKRLNEALTLLSENTAEYEEVKTEFALAKQSLNEATQMLADRESELGSVKNKLQTVTNQYSNTSEQLLKELAEKTETIEASGYHLSQTLAENDALKSEVDIAVKRVNENAAENATHIANLNQQLESVTEKYACAEEELKAARGKNIALKNEFETSTSSLKEETSVKTKFIAELEESLQDLNSQLQAANTLADEMKSQMAAKEQKLQDKETLISKGLSKQKQLEKRLATAFENLQQHSGNELELKEQLFGANEKINGIKHEKELVEQNLGKIMFEKEALENQINHLSSKVDTLTDDYAALETEWKQRAHQLAQRFKVEQEEAAGYKEYSEQLEAHVASLDIRVKEAENAVNLAYKNIAVLEDDKHGIQKGYKENLDSLCSQLIAEKEKAQELHNQLNDAYASNDSMSKKVKKQLRDTQVANETYRKRLEERFQDYEEMKRTYTSLQCELANKVQEAKDVKRVSQHQLVRLQADLDAAVAINVKNDEHSEDLAQQLLASERRQEEAYRQINIAQEQAEKVHHELAMMKESMTRQITELSSNLISEKDRNTQLQEKILTNLDTVHKYENTKNQLRREREEAYRELAAAEVQLAKKESELIALNEEMSGYKRAVARSGQGNKNDYHRVKELTKTLERAEQHIYKLEDELTLRQDELEDLHEAYVKNQRSMSLHINSLKSDQNNENTNHANSRRRRKGSDIAEVEPNGRYIKRSNHHTGNRSHHPRSGLKDASGTRY